jgi:hypothetical protein
VTIRSSAFREALQVSPERISNLNDSDLTTLMGDLLLAHAYRCGAAVSEIRVNAEVKASDGGCDGWSPRPATTDEWFGASDTCWQFKAGVAGQPARLRGEITKDIPADTLKKGGRVVVVASGSTSGVQGEQDRLEVLREEAKAQGVPTDGIDVIGSDRLTVWCNLHPTVAGRFAGRPEGLWLLDEWLRNEEHRVAWQSTPALQAVLADKRQELDFSSNAVLHLHIQGPPGVGKTRFALEICREANWQSTVVYVRQASDGRLLQLIDGATAEPGVRLVVVADEVQKEQLRPLRDSLDRGDGRVRLITIGHCKSPDDARIPALEIRPLDAAPMANVIRGWHPTMPREHVDFVTRFAAGYVRLARLAANAVARDSSIDMRGLLDLHNIREFFDTMLGDGNREALYVVAVLGRIGWTDDVQVEGEAVAQHLKQDWNKVRASVEDFQRRLGIVPRGGRYRYISPKPLAIYLAVEAWTTFPNLLQTLPSVLRTEEAKIAYDDRLEDIASNPQARKFAREKLAFFFRVTDFAEPWDARRWSALSAADPTLAVRNILKALSSASPDEKLAIGQQARREVVNRLVQLAWSRATFHDATLSLALLAEAENETWASNASREFIARFEVALGGTSVPYVERMGVIDELLAIGRPGLNRLVVKALARVGNRHHMRWGGSPESDVVPEQEWHPRTGPEMLACVEEALGRLTKIARNSAEELRTELLTAARELSMLLREDAVRGSVAGFFEAVRETHPVTREPLRRVIADIVYRERKYWKELSPKELATLEAVHARFEDGSLGARLRQRAGPGMWEKDEAQNDLGQLALELVRDRTALDREWSWLTSGDAGDAWKFGEALAVADVEAMLDEVLAHLAARGPDLRVLCGYVSKRREQRGDVWFDAWVTQTFAARPDDLALLFEVSWRCGVTVATARILAAAVREQDIRPQLTRQLENGTWPQALPLESLKDLLTALCGRGHRTTAVAVLEHRLRTTPTDLDPLEPIALEVVTSGEVIRDSAVMTDFYWKEVALRLVAHHARAIAAAIFREQADHSSAIWFAEYSTAKEVLLKCVSLDPAGVWQALEPHLSSLAGLRFSVGFPSGLLDSLPADDIGRWVTEDPEEHASVIARLVNKSLMNDKTLTARILGQFGDNRIIASEFFSAFASGSWTGPSSLHWAGIAGELERVARSTTLPKLRRWAEEAAEGFRRMQERDAQREEEEEVRGR